MRNYPHLFPKPEPGQGSGDTNIVSAPPPQQVSSFLPLIKSEQRVDSSSAIDRALAEKLRPAELLRLKAMDYTIQFLNGRVVVSPDDIEKMYDKFYNKIKNGRQEKQQGLRR